MKKEVFLFGVLIMALICSMSYATADTNASGVDKAYECLEEKVEEKCDALSSEERIFALLAIGECQDEIIADSQNDECWPGSGCRIKTTAQAILALDKANVDVDEAVEWLSSQNTTPKDIDWFLQIESSEETTCTITYSGSSYQITIGEDKKISSGAGSCLSLSEGAWWLKVSSGCYNEEFEIKCHDNSFLTNLLFKKTTSSTIYVSEKTTSASAEASTYEKINSLCFAQGGSCDYEGSLWAALVLDYLDKDISSYLPYLVIGADENTRSLPESFLYFLTGEFRNDLLSKQMNSEYWSVSGDKFYDTALALYPFSDEPQEKTNSKNWLLEVQDNDGCWQGNVRNTAFILHSLWPRDFGENGDDENGDDENGEEDEIDCEDAGYYCISSISCQEAGGNELDYSCAGMFVCCDKEQVIETCSEQGGEICNSNENCIGGTSMDTFDLDYGETCCIGGRCEEPEEEADCEDNFGTCREECEENEEESFDYACDSWDICCMEKTIEDDPKNYLWVWILLGLIFLIVVGIIFKDKLRTFWFRTKSKFGKSRPGPRPGPRFGFPPSRRMPLTRPMPRRILPPTQRPPVRRPMPKPKAKPKTELDDVLKKLKEMGK